MCRMSKVLTLLVALSQVTVIQANNCRAAISIRPNVAQAYRGYDAEKLQLVDARKYWHCHNLPGRTYCHKGERLPRNWPPNSNTPGTSSLRNLRHAHHSHAGDYQHDYWFWRR